MSLGRRYPHELLVVSLVAIAALSFFSYVGPQDVSRLALSHALVFDRSVRIDRWAGETIDKARRDGHFYTDKAPGMSLAAAPTLAAMAVSGLLDSDTRVKGVWTKRSLVWILRVFTGGVAFVAVVFLVGRAAESLVEGTGARLAGHSVSPRSRCLWRPPCSAT